MSVAPIAQHHLRRGEVFPHPAANQQRFILAYRASLSTVVSILKNGQGEAQKILLISTTRR